MKTQHLCILIICAVIGFSCSPPKEGPIRIGINPWPGYEFLYLAQEKGFYQQAGIDVRIVEFSSLGDVRRAYEQGLIDAMGCTLFEVVLAKYHSHRNPKIISVADFSRGSDVILTHSEINNVKALRGKRIGVEYASIGVYMLSRALSLHNLRLEDVQMIPMSQLHQEQGFLNQEIDAVVTYPPVLNRLLRTNNTHVVFSSADIPGEVIDTLIFDAQVISKRRTEIEKIITIWQQAVHFTTQHPDESYAIMAAREHITPQEYRKSLAGLEILSLPRQLDLLKELKTLQKAISEVISVLQQTQQIETVTPIATSELVDASLIESVLQSKQSLK